MKLPRLWVLEQHADFVALAVAVEDAVQCPGCERGGWSPFPTEPMVRMLPIQPLFNRRDEQMEF